MLLHTISISDQANDGSVYFCTQFLFLIRQLASWITHNKTLANRNPRTDNSDTVNPQMIKNKGIETA